MVYPETPEPLQILDADTYSQEDFSAMLAECIEEEGTGVNVEELLSSDSIKTVGKLLKGYVYMDFFALLNL